MDEKNLYKAFAHTLSELQIPNIALSLQIVNFKLLQKVHDSLHEFIYLAPLSSSTQYSWHSKSAFLTYHYVTCDQAHRSFIEALTGYYNTANIILRSVLELLLKGALWECLAHKEFRNKANVIEKETRIKIGNSKKTIISWLNDKIQPEKEKELKETSVGIFDILAPLFEDNQLVKLIPTIKVILKQLDKWKILEPYKWKEIYEIYKRLSRDVHVMPDKTDIGRRLLAGRDLFEVEPMLNELEEYLKILHRIMDIGVVIELNILSDWIIQNETVKTKLKERLSVLRDLELRCGFKKLLELVEDER